MVRLGQLARIWMYFKDLHVGSHAYGRLIGLGLRLQTKNIILKLKPIKD